MNIIICENSQLMSILHSHCLLLQSSHLKMQQETNFKLENGTSSISKSIDERLNMDIMQQHTVGESGTQLYKCEECEEVFKSKLGLSYHTSSTH
jgi:hypothetical protein